MDFLLPQISISPPPPEEPVVEPYSPFSALSPPTQCEVDTFRPVHLTPPPNVTTFRRQPLSPLRPRETVVSSSKGLERERFEALLKASRERNSLVGSRKEVDLRKEITLKAHKTKQDERRARFLSKILEPPSPTAMLTPKTPPDSPAIFHYSLPSPGLVSPLALFESLTEEASGPFSYGREPWVEKVDFRLMQCPNTVKSPTGHLSPGLGGRGLPSLDQISARLNSQGHAHARPRTESRPARLPQFLKNNRTSSRNGPKHSEVQTVVHILKNPQANVADVLSLPTHPVTLKAPRSLTPTQPSLALSAAASRERRALDMLSTIKRRTQMFGEVEGDITDPRRLKWKRHSAPADIMPLHQREGFEHPVLSLPGGF